MNAESWAILGVGIGVFSAILALAGLLYAMIRDFREDFNKKFEAMDKRWVETNKRMDEQLNKINMRMDGVYHVLLKRIKEE